MTLAVCLERPLGWESLGEGSMQVGLGHVDAGLPHPQVPPSSLCSCACFHSGAPRVSLYPGDPNLGGCSGADLQVPLCPVLFPP